MLGSSIIDKLMSKKQFVTDFPNIDKQWLVTSSFHDVAYPLQLYDNWAKSFFEDSLGIPNLGVSDIKSYFVENSLLSSVGFVISELCERHFGSPLKGNWLNTEKSLLLFFHDRITKHKHHSILSSIFLIKQAQSEGTTNLKEIFVPSALAIALHHYDQVFNKAYEKDVVWDDLPENRKIQSIDFAVNPLAFVLMFCDCAQEWGRPKFNNKPLTELEDEQAFVLDNCSINDNDCSITISSPKWKSTERGFLGKEKEIDNLPEDAQTS